MSTIADALRDKLTERGHHVLAVAVAKVHAHLLVEFPDDLAVCRAETGIAKRSATEQVKAVLKGRLWSVGGTFKPIADHDHQRQTFNYITTEQRPAWVWDFRDGGRMVR